MHTTWAAVAITVLLNAAIAAESTGTSSVSWPVDQDIVQRIRHAVEGARATSPSSSSSQPGKKVKNKPPLTLKDELQDLFRNLGTPGNDGGSGWHTCGIDTVSGKGMARAHFNEHHANKPTRILGAMNDWGAMKRWRSKSGFIAAEGNELKMHNSGAVYIASFGGKYNDGAGLPGQGSTKVGLEDLFVRSDEEAPESAFKRRTTIGFEVGESLAANRLQESGMFAVPPFLKFKDRAGNDQVSKPAISIGPAMSGLSFHSHSEAWLGLVGGEKLWLIAKPDALPAAEHGTGSAKTTWRWIMDGGFDRVPAGSVKICVQRRGEIIYLPRWYMHATINFGDAVGMGMQSDTLMEFTLNHSLPALKAKAAAAPAYRQMYQAVVTRIKEDMPLAESDTDASLADASTWLKMVATVFRNHAPTALTSATQLRHISFAFEEKLNKAAAGHKKESYTKRAAALRGASVAIVLELHHQLQRELWSGRLAITEAVHTAELLGEFLEAHVEEHAAAVMVLRTALAWEPTLLRARQNLGTSYSSLQNTAAADKHFAVVFAIAGDVEAVRAAHTKEVGQELIKAASRLTQRFGTRYCKLAALDGATFTGVDSRAEKECPASSSCSKRQPSKGILRMAVLHRQPTKKEEHEKDAGDAYAAMFRQQEGHNTDTDPETSNAAPLGCVPVLIAEDDDGSHETLWLEEFFFLELGRGTISQSPLPPPSETVDRHIVIPAKGRTLYELLQ